MSGTAPTPAYVTDALDLMDEMEFMRDPILIRDALFHYLRGFGVDYLMMTRLPLPREHIAPHMLIKIWPHEWLTHYDAQRYYRDDPVAARCIASLDPFIWSDHAGEPRSPRAQRVMHEAREIGMCEGYCIPLHDVHGLQAVVTMAGRELDFPPRARRSAQMASLYAFGVIDRRAPIHRDLEPLSPRERDVLSCAAIGQSAHETARSLRIGETTVITHLRQARSKLSAANTTHAVVQAIRTRQISL